MKKKLLLIAAMVAVLSCLFAITAFAENKIIKLDTLPTLDEIHANREAYVSHLDDFDTSEYKERDPNSVVVMSDLQSPPTYYVFPSFYVLERTSHSPSVEKLNEYVANADSSAFATYAATGSRGGNKHIIRLELPTYVTILDGWNKFEGATNLKEVYFPTKVVIDEETGEEKIVTCVTTVTGQNTFTGCSNLETVGNFDKLPLGIYNNGAFSGCYPLTGIKLHEGITSIPSGMFSDCTALNNLVFPEGLVSIGSSAFQNCNAMTEVILPNSVVSIGKKTFAYMDNLVTINFGEGLSTLTSSDHNLELLDGCPNLKYVYMPACFATEVQNSGHGILRTGTNVTIFFTGTIEQAQAIKDKLPESSNPLIWKAEFIEYDESIDYTTYAETLGKTILVYNYNKCLAFYDGDHTEGENLNGCQFGCGRNCGLFAIREDAEHERVITALFGENGYFSASTITDQCAVCATKIRESALDALFISKGISAKSFGTDIGLVQGYGLNREAIEAYKTYVTDFDFGILACANASGEEITPVPGENGVIDISFDNMASDYIEVKLTGIPADKYDTHIVFCIYACEGGKLFYLDDGKTLGSVAGVSYSDYVEAPEV